MSEQRDYHALAETIRADREAIKTATGRKWDGIFDRQEDRLSQIEDAFLDLLEDKARLDYLDSINTRMNWRNGTRYGWRIEINHLRVALADSHAPFRTVREAIDDHRTGNYEPVRQAAFLIGRLKDAEEEIDEARIVIEGLREPLQQFVNAVQTHAIATEQDEVLANVMRRAKAGLDALAKADLSYPRPEVKP